MDLLVDLVPYRVVLPAQNLRPDSNLTGDMSKIIGNSGTQARLTKRRGIGRPRACRPSPGCVHCDGGTLQTSDGRCRPEAGDSLCVCARRRCAVG
eukprot:COSAG02_NODE_29119_length_575_cov_6.039916_1_plen_94_part_10